MVNFPTWQALCETGLVQVILRFPATLVVVLELAVHGYDRQTVVSTVWRRIAPAALQMRGDLIVVAFEQKVPINNGGVFKLEKDQLLGISQVVFGSCDLSILIAP